MFIGLIGMLKKDAFKLYVLMLKFENHTRTLAYDLDIFTVAFAYAILSKPSNNRNALKYMQFFSIHFFFLSFWCMHDIASLVKTL